MSLGIGALSLLGMEVFVSPNIPTEEQFRFPHSKKQRIRNKWVKRPENWRPFLKVVVTDHALYCHPAMKARLDKAVNDHDASVADKVLTREKEFIFRALKGGQP